MSKIKNRGALCNVNGERIRKNERIGYLSNPKISLGFMCHNMIKLRGKCVVESSFNAMHGQSKDIMVVDNFGKDRNELRRLCDKYDFRFFSVKRNPKYNFEFDCARVSNKIVLEAQNDIIVRLSPEILYPYNFVWYIASFFKKHSPKKCFLSFRFLNVLKGGAVCAVPGEEWTLYKPYFMLARGWDERSTYFRGEDHYSISIMTDVFNCKKVTPSYLFLKHRDHAKKKGYQSVVEYNRRVKNWNWKEQINLLRANVKKNRRLVENGQW